MIIMPQTFIQIVAAGGGMIIDLEKNILFPDTMIRIASAAAHSGAKVTFRVGRTIVMPDTMVKVAVAGRGNVVFDVS